MTLSTAFAAFAACTVALAAACDGGDDTNSVTASVEVDGDATEFADLDAVARGSLLLDSVAVQAVAADGATVRVTFANEVGTLPCGEVVSVGFAQPEAGVGCTTLDTCEVTVTELPFSSKTGS